MALKLPKIRIEPKPKRWDLVAVLVLAAGAAVAAVSWQTARSQPPGETPSGTFTTLVVVAQLAVCMGSLLVLGKTAKEGTLWGNLAAVGGTFAGMGGILLAAALWAAA